MPTISFHANDLKSIPKSIIEAVREHDLKITGADINLHIGNAPRSQISGLLSEKVSGFRIERSQSKAAARCSEGKVFNPTTEKCIKADGKLAKKLGLAPASEPKKKKAAPAAKKDTSKTTRKTKGYPKPKKTTSKTTKAAETTKTTRKVVAFKTRATATPDRTCVSSKLQNTFIFFDFKDKLIEKHINDCGGKVESTLTDDVKYLIMYDTSLKKHPAILQAVQMKIGIVSYANFLKSSGIKQTDTRVISPKVKPSKTIKKTTTKPATANKSSPTPKSVKSASPKSVKSASPKSVKSASPKQQDTCSRIRYKVFVFIGFEDNVLADQIIECGGEVQSTVVPDYTSHVIIYNRDLLADEKLRALKNHNIKIVLYEKFIRATGLKSQPFNIQ